jgi:uncharacterized membrane protein YjgN (DUF898 family)
MKALEFKGSGSEYFKIWIVNVLLTIITFGLYYPWAKVRNKRYFYGNSVLDGRNFDYHATGKQIFLGYLISMVLLIAYMIIQQASPNGSLILLGVLFLAVPWIIVRSMMFNMKMSSFSNVHFQFSGGFGQAYINFFAYPLAMYLGFILLGVLAGVALPLAQMSENTFISLSVMLIVSVLGIFFAVYAFAFIKKKTTEYVINHSHFGQGKFQVNLELKKLKNIVLGTTGVGILSTFGVFVIMGILVYVSVGMESIAEISSVLKDKDAMEEKSSLILPIVGTIYLGLILSMIITMSYSFAKNRSYTFANTILDDTITFESTLKALPLAWVLISNFFLVILTFGLAMPWTKVRTAKLILNNTLASTSGDFDKYISLQQTQTSALGDQIGEAFDVDVNVGF